MENKKILHGNLAKATDKSVESAYKTSTIPPKNGIDTVTEENVIIAKKCVDENHK